VCRRHCEERSDEAIQKKRNNKALLAQVSGLVPENNRSFQLRQNIEVANFKRQKGTSQKTCASLYRKKMVND